MNTRRFICSLSPAVCVAMLCAVGLQHHQLVGLRADKQRKVADQTAATDAPTAPLITISPPVSRELLQLRNQVGQLRRRRDELLDVRADHERLIVQFAARGTNGLHLPTNYIRQAQARLVGYNTPEDTLQSFLYAIRNLDYTNILQALTPEAGSRLKAQFPQSSDRLDKFFDGSRALIGLSILGREQRQPDFIAADVQILPGLPSTFIYFRLTNGQWKMDGLP